MQIDHDYYNFPPSSVNPNISKLPLNKNLLLYSQGTIVDVLWVTTEPKHQPTTVSEFSFQPKHWF